MHFRIGTVDGTVHTSDDVSETELQKHLDSVGGRIGTGDWANTLMAKTVDEFLEWFSDVMMNKTINGMDPTEVSVQIDGRYRVIAPRHIVWYEIIRDKEN